jgi:hypothetical protein
LPGRCLTGAIEFDDSVIAAASDWIDDINVGIIDYEWFRPISHCLANQDLHMPPFTG